MDQRDDEGNEGNEGSTLHIFDTRNGLTTDELAELKKLAALSKITRYLVTLAMGAVAAMGVPEVLSWLTKHFGGHP